MELIARQDAKLRGLTRYFTGKECARGHICERYVISTDCLECCRENARRKRRQNYDHYLAKSRVNNRRRRERERPAREAEKLRRRIERGAKQEATRVEREAVRRAKQRAWRLANPERNRKLILAWKSANLEKVRADKRGRKIRKRKETIELFHAKQRGRCAYCRERLVDEATHIDHIHARSRGGSNERRNLQLTCDDCNVRKGVKPPETFAREMGRLL